MWRPRLTRLSRPRLNVGLKILLEARRSRDARACLLKLLLHSRASFLRSVAPYLSCERDQAEGLSASEDQNNAKTQKMAKVIRQVRRKDSDDISGATAPLALAESGSALA